MALYNSDSRITTVEELYEAMDKKDPQLDFLYQRS